VRYTILQKNYTPAHYDVAMDAARCTEVANRVFLTLMRTIIRSEESDREVLLPTESFQNV
jgi:hypothetical protein